MWAERKACRQVFRRACAAAAWLLAVALAGAVLLPLAGCAAAAQKASWNRLETPADAMPPAHAGADTIDQAVSLAGEGEFERARALLEPLVPKLKRGDSPLYEQAAFWLAFCCEKTGESLTARDLYRDLIENYPDSTYARLARLRLSQMNEPELTWAGGR